MPRPHADPTGRKQGSSVGSARRPHATSASAESARREITVLIRTERPRRQSGNLRHSRRGGERTHLRRRFPRKAVADQFRAAAAMPVLPRTTRPHTANRHRPGLRRDPPLTPRTPNPSTEPKRCPGSRVHATASPRPQRDPPLIPRAQPTRRVRERGRASAPGAPRPSIESAGHPRTPSPRTWPARRVRAPGPCTPISGATPHTLSELRVRTPIPHGVYERCPRALFPSASPVALVLSGQKARDRPHTLIYGPIAGSVAGRTLAPRRWALLPTEGMEGCVMKGCDWILLLLIAALLGLTFALARLPLRGERRRKDSQR